MQRLLDGTRKWGRRDFVKLGLLGTCGLVATKMGLNILAAGGTMPPMPLPSPVPYFLGPPVVSAVHCPTYNYDDVQPAVQATLELVGGVSDIIKPSDKVGVKPNLTSCHAGSNTLGITTDAGIVRALINEIKSSVPGVEVWILEGEYRDAFKNLGYDQVATETGSYLLDTNHPDPYEDFAQVQTRSKLWYESFSLNRIYTELDVLISVSKMKMHSWAGVTVSQKNLVGCMPLDIYKDPQYANRGPYVHDGDSDFWRQLARVIADLNTTIPIHFSVVDGVIGRDRGAGTWTTGSQPVESKVILAGKNAVATDAVATKLMGHEPTNDFPAAPFINGQSHLRIAQELGLGPSSLDQIQINLEDGYILNDLTVDYSPPDPDTKVPSDWEPGPPVTPIPELPTILLASLGLLGLLKLRSHQRLEEDEKRLVEC